jgi:hypothetical protein
MRDSKILLSLSAHEAELALVDQCFNYLVLGKFDFIIIHINSYSPFDTDLFLRLAGKIPHFDRKVLLNPTRCNITTHSQYHWHVTNLHLAHAANYRFALERKIPFDIFCLDASNSLLIKTGLKDWLLSDTQDGLDCVEMEPRWFWAKFARDDKVLLTMSKNLYIAQHEGTFYHRDRFGLVMRKISQYQRNLTLLIESGDTPPEYPREEVLFSSFYSEVMGAIATRKPFINLPWEKNLKWSLDDVDLHLSSSFNDFPGHYFGIKRVPRNINDPIRILIGNKYGYRAIIKSALS